MAKKKKVIADKVRNRKGGGERKVNPFEVKLNHQKHNILGRKIPKHDKGLPGVSRSKAIKRRKETLLQEYKHRTKANSLQDRRIGENDPSLSMEEKMLKRYAVERERRTGGSKFNLNDDEELTHFGQSLAEIEKFDEPDVSDEEDSGRIGGDMVAEAHFGGFLTKKDPTAEDSAERKSWKEKMEEMITKSKKSKFERQSEKEKTLEMTEHLDDQWKEVAHLLGTLKGKSEKESKPAVDEYDMAVRELKYELKGKATDRLKTEEEIAKDEKERLEKLEADRVRRMKGILTDTEKPVHRSADSLDDGLALDDSDRNRVKVRFHDGKMVQDKEEEENSEEDEEKSEDSSDDDNDEENDGENVDDGDENEEGEAGNEQEDEEESDDDEEDDYADVLADSDADEKEEVKKTSGVKSILKKAPETEEDKKKKDEIKNAAKKELPYTFPAPDNYESLLELLQGRSPSDQLTVVERIRKCHHSSLAEGNQAKLETFLRLLIQYYGSLTIKEKPVFSLMDKLMVHIYELTQMSPGVAADVFKRILQHEQSEFQTLREKRRPVFLGLDTLLYLKLASLLFPTSDYSHPVTTPALILMGQLVSQCPVQCERDVAFGLFLSSLCFEYVSESKRFVPEVVSFLHGVLFLAAKKEKDKIERLSGSIKPVGKAVNLLYINDKEARCCDIKPMKMSKVFGSDLEKTSLSSSDFKLSLIHCCVSLIQDFSSLYTDLPAYTELFSPLTYMCKRLPVENYPQTLKDKILSVVKQLEGRSNKPRQSLTYCKAKPKPLPMFEPQVEEVWDGHKKKGGKDRLYNEKQRLLHKVKRERKGALREIRKDTQFLARHKLQETMQKDAERKRKVKALYGNLANQEGDYKALKRKKKK